MPKLNMRDAKALKVTVAKEGIRNRRKSTIAASFLFISQRMSAAKRSTPAMSAARIA